MKSTRRQLDPETSGVWARTVHILALDAIAASDRLVVGQLAFHGGTSLRLSWHSPRFSEDLDFLLDRQVEDIGSIMQHAATRVAERFGTIDRRFTVSLSNKSKDESRMGSFMLTVGHPDYYGVAKVKVEFWRVPRDYLEKYPTELRVPRSDDDVMARASALIMAADLEAAFCDKLTAFATRSHLKWRDLFDLWWIGTQTDTPLDTHAIVKQLKHNASAYNTLDGLPLSGALRKFLARDREAVAALADPDIKRWLPPEMWKQMQGDGVKQIVDYVYSILGMVSLALEDNPSVPQSLPKRRSP